MLRPIAISLIVVSTSAGMALAKDSTTNPPAAAETPARTGETQEGMTAVETTSRVVTFTEAGPADVLTSSIIGVDVVNSEGAEIGEIKDLVIADGITVRALIVEVGGFLGIGERYVAVDPGSVTLMPDDGDDDWEAVIDTNADELRKAPEVDYDGNWDVD